MPHADLGDITLYYEQHGTGRPVVCLHGLEGNRTHFYWLTRQIRGNELSLLLFDQRGAGLSTRPRRAASMEQIADDTVALMDVLGISSASVIGISMGGMVAQHLALRHPARVHRLVIGCSAPTGKTVSAANLPGATDPGTLHDIPVEEKIARSLRVEFSEAYRARHPNLAEFLREEYRAHPPDPQQVAWRMAALHAHDVLDRLGSIHCETIILAARCDAVISWQNSVLMAERMPNARLHVFESAGHRFWDEQEEEAGAIVRAFLTQ